jgi:magnesium chelatase subunit D
VVRRRLAYDADPAGFVATWAPAEAELAGRVAAARVLLPSVALPDEELARVAHVCAAFDVEGLRADIVVARTAAAHAAWHGRSVVSPEDVRAAARLALPHRRRRDPFEQPGLDEGELDRALDEAGPPPEPEPDPEPDHDPSGGGSPGAPPDAESDAGSEAGSSISGEPGPAPREGRAGTPEPTGRPRLLAVPGVGSGTAGRRSTAYTRSGRTVGARVPTGRLDALHLTATVLAAAPYQRARGRESGALRLSTVDIRVPVRQGREANLVLFAVDASGSMAARARMRAVTGAVLALLRDAYQRRDKVGLVTFRGTEARLALAPTSSVDVGAAALRDLPTGGRTPLAAGLSTAANVLRAERRRDPKRRALLVLVTDGRATAGGPDPVGAALGAARTLAAERVASVVVDCESGPVRLGLAQTVAGALAARYLTLDELSAHRLRGAMEGRAA